MVIIFSKLFFLVYEIYLEKVGSWNLFKFNEFL